MSLYLSEVASIELELGNVYESLHVKLSTCGKHYGKEVFVISRD